MKRDTLTRMIDRHGKLADNLMGLKAKLIHRTFGDFDVVTGNQAYTDQVTDVVVRSWPLTLRERIDLASAGFEQIDARWTMLVSYASELSTDDLLSINSFIYEVLPAGLTQDEFGVEWTILTRRRPRDGGS